LGKGEEQRAEREAWRREAGHQNDLDPLSLSTHDSSPQKKLKKNSKSVIWSAILVFGTALACFVCLRLTRSRIAARRREEALVIAAQRAQIDAEAASDAAAAAAEAGTATATGGGRGRRPSSSSAAAAAALAAAPRLSRTMIARLPTFNYVDPPAGQESDDDEAAGFVKGGDAERGNTAEEGEAASGGGATAAAAAATKPKKTFARSSSSGKRRCIVCLDPL